MLGVFSGQGGVAVGISGVGLYLAIVGALSGKKESQKESDATSISTLPTILLWLLASLLIVLCLYFTRDLLSEQRMRERICIQQSSDQGSTGKFSSGAEERDGDLDVDLDDNERQTLLQDQASSPENFLGGSSLENQNSDVGKGMGRNSDVGTLWEIFKRNVWLNFSVFWVFVVTLVSTLLHG